MLSDARQLTPSSKFKSDSDECFGADETVQTTYILSATHKIVGNCPQEDWRCPTLQLKPPWNILGYSVDELPLEEVGDYLFRKTYLVAPTEHPEIQIFSERRA